MKIDREKFLAMTALLAATTAGACSSSDNKSAVDDAGTGGKSAGGAADSGVGGSAAGGKGGTGVGGAGGSGGSATGGKDSGADSGKKDAGEKRTDGGDGGLAACLGDNAPAMVDAGSEGVDICSTLPLAIDGCQSDAAGEGLAPAYTVCSDFATSARPGVFAALASCLTSGTMPSNPCGAEAKNRAVACYDDAVARACPRAKVDGGLVDPCPAFAKSCAGVAVTACESALRAFSDESASFFADCVVNATQVGDAGLEGGIDCKDAFWICALPNIAR